MGARGMYRVSGQLAAFIAIAALLLQAACPAQLPSLIAASLAQPTTSGCHESNSDSPKPPNPEKKCCSGQHSPEVLLKATQPAPALVDVVQFEAQPVPVFASSHVRVMASPALGPPGALVLRI